MGCAEADQIAGHEGATSSAARRHAASCPICSPPDLASARGDGIGHYRLEEPLARGGMGVLFRARDLSLGRAVALKFLAAADETRAAARFVREGHAASAIDHPNVGVVLEVG